jgi:hypothetical protein
VGKSIDPDIDKRLLKRKWRHIGAPTLSPIPYGGDIYAIEIRISVVAFSRLRDQVAPILEIEGVREIGLPDGAIFVCGLVGPPGA